MSTKSPSSMLARMAAGLANETGCQCVHVGSSIELRRGEELQARLWLYQNSYGSTAIFEPSDPQLRSAVGNRVATFNHAMRTYFRKDDNE